MRTRNHSIVTALVLLSLVSGAIGCKNTGGPWYKPDSYSLYNPFKKEDPVPPYSPSKPSLAATPNVTPPPGGYGTEKHLQVQHGQTHTGGARPEPSQVAASDAPFYGGVHPDSGMYPQYSAPNQGPSGVAPPAYQQTSATISNHQPHYQGNPSDFSHAPVGSAPGGNYSPWEAQHNIAPQGGFSAPVGPAYDPMPQGGFNAPVGPAYDPMSQGGFNAPVGQVYDAAPQGFGAQQGYSGGYTANPSTAGWQH